MIFEAFFQFMAIILNFIISLFPTIPPMPTEFAAIGDFVINTASSATGIIKYLFSEVIFYSFLSVVTILLAWDNIVHIVKLILKLTLISKLLARF